MSDITKRPVDFLYPDRREALKEARCVSQPLGCGQPITPFRDDLSRKEYHISALCQDCQDKIFGTEEES